MRKLLVIVPVILALALALSACGGDSDALTVKIEGSAKDKPPYNVEGEWTRLEGESPHESFVAIIAHGARTYSGKSRFTTDQKGIRLKLDSESTLVAAEACYEGVDLFCKGWRASEPLPFVRTVTVDDKKYRVRLVWAFVGICDPAVTKPSTSKQTANDANQS